MLTLPTPNDPPMPISPKVIREFGKVYSGQGTDRFDQVWLPPRSFALLRDFVTEQGEANEEVGRAFCYGKRQGQEWVQVRNYVGVIQLSDGTHLEVLPKLLTHGPEAGDDQQAVQHTREVFLHMLRHLRDSPFIDLDQAQLKADRFPLLEVFIQAYVRGLDHLLKRGLQCAYQSHTANQPFLKGRLEVARHLQQNLQHPERFYVTYDTYALDSPWHRLLLATVLKLQRHARVLSHQRALQRQRFALDAVSPSHDLQHDWSRLDFNDRQYRRYHQLMRWSRIFLFDQSFTNFHGAQLNLALLFPMERVFEDYVGHWLRRTLPGWYIRVQDRRHHLVEGFRGGRAFGLRPDFVLTSPEGQTVVADAKWKRLDARQTNPPFGISQGDLYQLYAYGKKYSRPHPPKLWLLYPDQPALRQAERSLRFEADLWLDLRGVPITRAN